MSWSGFFEDTAKMYVEYKIFTLIIAVVIIIIMLIIFVVAAGTGNLQTVQPSTK